MTFGPVQMLVVGFDTDEFTGKIREELKRLKEAGRRPRDRPARGAQE